MHRTDRKVTLLGMLCGRPFVTLHYKHNPCLDAIECLRLPKLTPWVLADFSGITALHLCIADLTMKVGALVFRDNPRLPVNGVTWF